MDLCAIPKVFKYNLNSHLFHFLFRFSLNFTHSLSIFMNGWFSLPPLKFCSQGKPDSQQCSFATISSEKSTLQGSSLSVSKTAVMDYIFKFLMWEDLGLTTAHSKRIWYILITENSTLHPPWRPQSNKNAGPFSFHSRWLRSGNRFNQVIINRNVQKPSFWEQKVLENSRMFCLFPEHTGTSFQTTVCWAGDSHVA